jgi:hypothetical protein
VIPPGPGWPLRGYELALLITLRAYDMSEDLRTTVVRPEPDPLTLLGDRTFNAIAAELARARISVATAEHVSVERDHRTALFLRPSKQRLEVDRVLAMPALRGNVVDGIPVDHCGLVPTDAQCRIAGLDCAWAVGDCTSFPFKSGDICVEQADVVAANIAALAGAAVELRSFDPGRARELAGFPAGRFIEHRLALPTLASRVPMAGASMLTYLQRDLAAGWRGESR